MFTEKIEMKIQEEFQKLHDIIPEKFCEIEKKCEECSNEEKILLKYLYGSMPVSDAISYPFSLFLSYAKHGVYLKKHGLFTENIPDDIFLQYVVFHRINTEDLSDCRSFFYGLVKDVFIQQNEKSVSMEKAVKELNYWCASKVTYRASDDRTASPMTVYDSGYGRCGEESTFTVSVLRSVGIPARQIYAPRWSHCDDNHAWVEAWCDGEWKFLGACEPEEILNRGWFTSASSRAMLLHTRQFGEIIEAEEEIVEAENFVKEQNQTERYANTTTVNIQVCDKNQNPVPQALVSIEVLNYAQFYPIAQMWTNQEGKCNIKLGMGSIRVEVVKGEGRASQVIDTRQEQEIRLQLSTIHTDEKTWNDFVVYAPKDSEKNTTVLSKEQKKIQSKKCAHATKLRHERAHIVNEKFISQWEAYSEEEELKKAMLSTLTQKDLLDVKVDVLISHLEEAKQYSDKYDREIFTKYLLSPRIADETLTCYRKEILDYFSEDERKAFVTEPKKIWEYIQKNIKTVTREYDAIVTPPYLCLKNKVGSILSKDILFVAICRSFGIPARLLKLDGTKEYYKEGFQKVIPEEEKQGIVELSFGTEEVLKYEEEFAIVKKENTNDKLIHVEKVQDDMKIKLPVGDYEIIIQNRLPNGNIYARNVLFSVKEGETKKFKMAKYKADVSEMLESIPLPLFTLKDIEGQEHEFPIEMKGKKQLLMWLWEAQEPTEHILNEMAEKIAEFQNSNAEISFITRNQEAYQDRNIARILKKIPQIKTYTSEIEEDANLLGRRMYIDPERLPMIIVVNKNGKGVYATSGYNVGTAEMLLRVLKEIE